MEFEVDSLETPALTKAQLAELLMSGHLSPGDRISLRSALAMARRASRKPPAWWAAWLKGSMSASGS